MPIIAYDGMGVAHSFMPRVHVSLFCAGLLVINIFKGPRYYG